MTERSSHEKEPETGSGPCPAPKVTMIEDTGQPPAHEKRGPLLVLAVFGVMVLGAFILALFDPWLIVISLIGIGMIAGISARHLAKAVPVFALAFGLLYWAFNIFMFIQSNWWAQAICGIPIIGPLGCGAGSVITLPMLVADILSLLRAPFEAIGTAKVSTSAERILSS